MFQKHNENVAFSVYWAPLHRSVRVEGKAFKMKQSENERLWNERSRSARIGVFASPQSKPIPSRQYLDNIEATLKADFGSDKSIPIPDWVVLPLYYTIKHLLIMYNFREDILLFHIQSNSFKDRKIDYMIE